MPEKKIKIRMVHSAIGRDDRQERILRGLGLRKLYSERELTDTPSVRGMLAKVPHLVQVIAEDVVSAKPKAKKVDREVKANEAQ